MNFRLPETGLPGLGPLLDGSLWSEWAAEERVFALTDVRSAVRCRFTVRQFDDADAQSVGFAAENRAPDADFRIIGMRGDDKQIERAFGSMHVVMFSKTDLDGKPGIDRIARLSSAPYSRILSMTCFGRHPPLVRTCAGVALEGLRPCAFASFSPSG